MAERRQEIRPPRVLIASESKFQHEMFRRLFKQSGGQTVHVYSSDQTLDALETMSFALAVIDDCSRGIDGSWTLDVYRWCSVMAGKAGVPIMLLTNSFELAQQLNRERGDVLAIESNAAKIIQTLDRIGLTGKR
jgi:CheY-like chemotaxis protein